MSDKFGGAWRVREYVFDPSGPLVGTVEQTRHVESRGEGRLAVIQDCMPDADLAGHGMARFAGHHEFELSLEGARRVYHGPAVIGAGLTLGEGAMVGQGLWPEFGYNFTSFSILVTPERQLTGGVFHRAGRPLCTIMGVATPDTGEAPTLTGSSWPLEVAAEWRGFVREVDAQGKVMSQHAATRTYDGGGMFERRGEEGASLRVNYSPAPQSTDLGPHLSGQITLASKESAPLTGFAQVYGWRTEMEFVVKSDVVRVTECLDAEGHLVTIRCVLRDQVPQRYEVLHLQPA